tara:strand:+ start:1714 stop:2082 length:369 start_codon:yes stop_codon:yes gene_type:complete
MSTASIIERRCQQHWKKMGITSKEALQAQLQIIFEQTDNQSSALVRIYQLLFPDWDSIKQIEGFPEVGKEMWQYICQLFIEFDRQHHAGVLHGGIWLNNGFSSNDRLDGWEISFDSVKVIYA